jgi:hypothetical protein
MDLNITTLKISSGIKGNDTSGASSLQSKPRREKPVVLPNELIRKIISSARYQKDGQTTLGRFCQVSRL